ncbi:MAG TPA: SMP-30/gluconolactonase/LRE family protein [Rhizomicrobium sp.]|nr:SMP-30/gluconolactonase/LRE family protein [Rhizomicrobium sp.]
MRPVARAATTAGAILIAVLIAAILRTLYIYGVFTSVTPGFAGNCAAIAGVAGPEDIAIDEKSRLAFVSAFDRRARAGGRSAPQDGIYVLSLDHPDRLTKLAGTPDDFHPHGISLLRDADGLVLMAINHRKDGTNSVEIFDVSAANSAVALHQTGTIESRELVSLNAIAAVDRERFYIANDHGSTTAFGRALDDYLVLPRANLLYFDGTVLRVVAQHLAFPSGLALSPDGHFLYATEANARRLDIFARQPVSGTLDEAGTLAIPSNLDNLRFDSSGNLWVGSHPKALAMVAFRADRKKPAPSEIFKVTLTNGVPQLAEAVYTNNGEQIGGSSVAAVSGKTMLIGSPLDDHILACRLP